jgi:dTDP-4-dehydrorhamnose 3,5-epimerase
MSVLPTGLEGVVIVEPQVHADDRGFFVETFRADELAERGIDCTWVQDNHSRSQRGVVRGMHFSVGAGQAKLVRCAAGAICDVVVDVRPGSPQFGQWDSIVLDDVRHRQLYIPVGFAHGFCVLSEHADVVYKCSSYYDPELERGFAYDDPDVGIEWPDLELVVSERDRTAPRLEEVAGELPFAYPA